MKLDYILDHGLSRPDNRRERPGEELDPDDPRSPRELVHREKVRRLIRSLQVPVIRRAKSLP